MPRLDALDAGIAGIIVVPSTLGEVTETTEGDLGSATRRCTLIRRWRHLTQWARGAVLSSRLRGVPTPLLEPAYSSGLLRYSAIRNPPFLHFLVGRGLSDQQRKKEKENVGLRSRLALEVAWAHHAGSTQAAAQDRSPSLLTEVAEVAQFLILRLDVATCVSE